MLSKQINTTEVNRSWWYKLLRSVSMFCFRFWWLIWLVFILFLIFWFLFCFRSKNYACDYDQQIRDQIALINQNLDSCCDCNNRSIADIDRLRDSLGGHVGPITVTLKWETIDDLDLSLVEPSGNVIYFSRKDSPYGGHLDIDMNAGGLQSNDPIENIYYESSPPSGRYRVNVNFFSRKSNLSEVPFKVYVKFHEEVRVFDAMVTRRGQTINIFEFIY